MGLDLTGIGSVASFAKGLVDRFWPPNMDPGERAQIQLQLQDAVERREMAVVEAKSKIIVSEMQQTDNFTKRARPSLVYAGLAFIFLVHVAFPIIAWLTKGEAPALSLPAEFWWAWGGVCTTWVIGRSAEKRGAEGMAGKLAGLITGGK